MAYSTKIGDSQPTAYAEKVGALPISQTTAAKLADKDDPVNLKLISGKRLGAMYCYEVEAGIMEVVIAAGPEPTDPWVRLSSEAVTTDLTASVATDFGTDLVLTVAGDVGDAAGITVQLNLIENAINALFDNITTQINLAEAAINAIMSGNVITPA